ncbi:MAG: zinc metalloprotease HtpX [Candidatus Geothermarchaeales archaeon]
MSLWKLRLSVFGTLAVIIGLSTLFFTILMTLLGVSNLFLLAIMVVGFNLAQWLFAPYLIDRMYRAKEVSESDEPVLFRTFNSLLRKSALKRPKLMLADISLPNAFAYGSPLMGTKVAVTRGLLDSLEHEEVEAVIGHELGHLKHRDVQIMMFVSVLPAVFYFIGFSMLLSSMWGRRDRGGGAALIGLASMLLYWILSMFVMYLSRLREYYADRYSASIVEDGPRKLSEGLAKIVASTAKMRKTAKMGRRGAAPVNSGFKNLFISDPDKALQDTVELSGARGFRADQRLVREILSRKITTAERMAELFSSHPNIVKRLRALQALS